MKGYKQAIAVALCVVLIMLVARPTSAELRWQSSFWSSSTYFQGDSGSLIVTLYGGDPGCECRPNNIPQTYVKEVKLQFDWQQPLGQGYTTNVGQNISIATTGTYELVLSIPNDTSVGPHAYTIYYVGQFADFHNITSGSIYIHSAFERIYADVLPTVQQKLLIATNVTFQSPDAKSILIRAQVAFAQALTLAQQGAFQDAGTSLKASSNLVDRAYSAEQIYLAQVRTREQQQGTQNAEIFGGVAIVVGTLAGSGLVLKRKKSSP